MGLLDGPVLLWLLASAGATTQQQQLGCLKCCETPLPDGTCCCIPPGSGCSPELPPSCPAPHKVGVTTPSVVACHDPADCTADVQRALDDSTLAEVTLPATGSPWPVTPLFLRRSNVVLNIEAGATLEAKKGSFLGTNDCLFTILGAANVSIRAAGATLRMRRPYLPPLYQPAEWRHVLSIRAASDVTVEGATLSDSGGDGVMIAGGHGANFSTRVTLRNLTVQRAWRNGLSVISVKGLLVEDCTFEDTHGTNPQFGIDLEPDPTPFGYLVGLVFRRVRLRNNLNGGFTAGLYGLVGEPGGAEGVSLLIEGMQISGSSGNRTECHHPNGTARVCSHRGVGMQLANFPVGAASRTGINHTQPSDLPHGSFVLRDVHIWNCSASGVDIEDWVRHRIHLTLDNLTIGRGVATLPQYSPDRPDAGPPVPIALGPYDTNASHLVGGVTFGPRPANIDMRDFATAGAARPWLSILYTQSGETHHHGMADVGGVADVLTHDRSMCAVAAGDAATNVSVKVNCKVV